MTLKAGAKRDGTLTALHLRNVGVVGAYPGWAGVGYQVADLYLCANVRVEETSVMIHAGKERAMRALASRARAGPRTDDGRARRPPSASIRSSCA
jgi:CO/xanthine dehydrogenase Mo-binding subunit